GAQFLGFAQVLVYIGAVSILIVFVILLTGGGEPSGSARFSSGAWLRVTVPIALLVLLLGVTFSSKTLTPVSLDPGLPPTVRDLGKELMSQYVLPLEILGLLLTAALVGAIVLALPD